MRVEHKQIDSTKLEFKDGTDNAPPRVRMYFSTFGNWDSVRPRPERPVPGAFKKFLPQLIKSGFSSVNHNMDALPVATIEDAGEDGEGAWAEIEYHTHQAALDAYAVAKQRYVRGKDVSSSFAYIVHKDNPVDIDDEELKSQGITRGRELLELEVKELGFVNMPANPRAVFTSVKSLLPPNMTFAEQLDATLDIVLDTKERAYEVQELRTKEGRAINADRRARLTAIRDALATLAGVKDELDTLLQETEPAPKSGEGTDQPTETPKSLPEDDADVEMAQLYARFYARKAGVTIP